MNVRDTAMLALERGFSFLPVKADGTKAPATNSWGEFINRRPGKLETMAWFPEGRDVGIAIVGGKVSGNLEILDFDVDAWEYYYLWRELMINSGYQELLDRVTKGYQEESPKPGVHIMYRCEEPVEGSRKLAQRYKLDDYGNRVKKGASFEREVLIETRGEGGYVICAPSSGGVHPSGRPYTLLAGGLDQIATITGEERQLILRLASEFDEVQQESFAGARQPRVAATYPAGQLTAGADFNARGDWEQLLTSAGWKLLRRHSSGKIEWVRPGSDSPVLHATTGAKGADVFYSFSPNTEFVANQGYSKFAVYAILNHGGDFSAAARTLGEQGYGEQVRKGGRITFNNKQAEEVVEEAAREEVAEGLDLARFQAHDEGNAEAFMSVYGDDFRYSPAIGYLYWNGRCWVRENAEAVFHAKVVEVLIRRGAEALGRSEAVYKASIPNAAKVAAAKQMITPKLTIRVDELDSWPDHLNVGNGVIDLRTGELGPHLRSWLFTYCIEYNYREDADSSLWVNFLKGAVSDPDTMVPYLQKAVGYTLTGRTNEETLFFLYGPPRAGKGTFTETLLRLLGEDLSAEVDFQTFASKRDGDTSNFDLAPLKAARAVFASESERHDRLNRGKVTALTGGNMVRCCFKHKDHFQYKPQYKIWLSSNWGVNGDADDGALWSRVKVVPFPNSHLGSEDKGFKQRMGTQGNMEGVLAWAVAGAKAWYALGDAGLSTPDVVADATQAQRDASDFVQEWLEAATCRDEPSWTANSELWQSYEQWCKSNGVPAKSQKAFSTTLAAKGYLVGKVRRIGPQTAKGVQGLRLNAQ